jgi:tetratricopeptide (TPR) repeat protein
VNYLSLWHETADTFNGAPVRRGRITCNAGALLLAALRRSVSRGSRFGGPCRENEPLVAAGPPSTDGEIEMRVLMVSAVMAATFALPAGAIAEPLKAAPPAATIAEPSNELRQCLAKDGVTPSQKLSACTVVIEQSGTPAQQRVQALIARGMIFFPNPPDVDRAIKDFDQAILFNPGNGALFGLRALAYVKKEQYDRAIQDYDEEIRLDPKGSSGLISRGDAYRAKAQYDRAIRDFDQAIAISPNLTAAFLGRALAYRDKAQWDFDAYLYEGRYEDLAIQDLDQVLRVEPTNLDALGERAHLLVIRQHYDRALADYNEAIRLAPNYAIVLRNRGDLFRITGQYARAIADYRATLNLKLVDSFRTLVEKSIRDLGGGL